jgi:hypothetical protein
MFAGILMLSRLQRLNTRDLSSKNSFWKKTLLLVRIMMTMGVAMNDERIRLVTKRWPTEEDLMNLLEWPNGVF